MPRPLQQVLIILCVSLLAACGGGGTSDSDAGGTAPPPPPTGPTAASVNKAAGDAQTAAPGSAVTVAPEVTVLDSAGKPIAGVAVTFAVTAGGGSVETPEVTTDTAGHAATGSWKLGSAKGVNTLTATVASLAPVVFSATSANKSADISVGVSAPGVGHTVGNPVTATASVQSTYQLASVTATFNDSQVALTYGPYGAYGVDAWSGTLSLAGQPRGPGTVIVTATDVKGNSTDVVVPVLYDQPPTVTITAPIDGTVARPTTLVSATCADDDPAGCSALRVAVEGKQLAATKDSISQSFDLSAYEGKSVTLTVTSVDSIGQQASATRTVYIESSGHLSTLAELNGPVWDISGTRILFVDTTGTTPALKIYDMATGATQTIETSSNVVNTRYDYGFLTAIGALYVHGSSDNSCSFACLYEWRGTAMTKLSDLDSGESLRVAGNWAIYNSDPSQPLWLRDIGAGRSALVANEAGNWMNDVATNGDVVYWSVTESPGYNIYRLRGGLAQALTNDPYPTVLNFYPVTDGTSVVYVKETGCCTGSGSSANPSSFEIALNDGTMETTLTTTPSDQQPTPGTDYAIAGGFVAYAQQDNGGVRQIWRHSPSGEKQITSFGSSSTIAAIGSDGTVVLDHGSRYRSAPGADLESIGSTLGRVVYRDGNFYVVLGSSVLKVEP